MSLFLPQAWASSEAQWRSSLADAHARAHAANANVFAAATASGELAQAALGLVESARESRMVCRNRHCPNFVPSHFPPQSGKQVLTLAGADEALLRAAIAGVAAINGREDGTKVDGAKLVSMSPQVERSAYNFVEC